MNTATFNLLKAKVVDLPVLSLITDLEGHVLWTSPLLQSSEGELNKDALLPIWKQKASEVKLKHWYHIKLARFPDSDLWIGILTEIDSYKSAHDNLQKKVSETSQQITDSREFLNTVLENIPHMVFVKDARDLRFVHFNRAGEELLGHDRKDLLGKNDFDFFPIEQANLFVEKDHQVLNSGKLTIIEEEIATKNGTRILRTKKIPLYGVSGKPAYLLGISEDITEWIEAQKSKQELMTAKLMTKERETSLKKALFLSDINSTLVSSLDYKVTLRDLAHKMLPLLGDWCTIFLIAEDQSLERVSWAHADSSKDRLLRGLSPFLPKTVNESASLESVIRTGKTLFIKQVSDELLAQTATSEDHLNIMRELGCDSCIIVPIRYHGKIYGAITLVKTNGQEYGQEEVLVAEEIGNKAGLAIENAMLYITAQKAIEVRNEFLSIASHELKTPLTALKLQLQMTRQEVSPEKNEVPSAEKLARGLDSANTQVNRLTRLIEDLLDVSRIESGRINYNFTSFDVSVFIRELDELYSDTLRHSGCDLTIVTKGATILYADRARLEQVLLNLLSNAGKYGAGRPVTLEVVIEAKHVLFKVRDQGMGIPADKLKTIFDRFVRAVTSHNISGLGLGLYISREIVKAHGGEIWAESDSQGTTFTVKLPLSK